MSDHNNGHNFSPTTKCCIYCGMEETAFHVHHKPACEGHLPERQVDLSTDPLGSTDPLAIDITQSPLLPEALDTSSAPSFECTAFDGGESGGGGGGGSWDSDSGSDASASVDSSSDSGSF